LKKNSLENKREKMGGMGDKKAVVITDAFGISSATLPFLSLHHNAIAINIAAITHPAANTGRDNIPSEICTIFAFIVLVYR